MSGTVHAIYSRSESEARQSAKDTAELVAEQGLKGDRYFGSGVVSLIEREAFDEFVATTGLDIIPGDIGRNIITDNVRLNPLDGKQFHIGGVLVEAFELCEPCASLGAKLATPDLPAKEIIRLLVHKAGLRVKVLSDGVIEPGASVA